MCVYMHLFIKAKNISGRDRTNHSETVLLWGKEIGWREGAHFYFIIIYYFFIHCGYTFWILNRVNVYSDLH